MIPLIKTLISRVWSNSEVVMKFTQIDGFSDHHNIPIVVGL